MTVLNEVAISDVDMCHEELLSELFSQMGAEGSFFESTEGASIGVFKAFFERRVRPKKIFELMADRFNDAGIPQYMKKCKVAGYTYTYRSDSKKLIAVGKFAIVGFASKRCFSKNTIVLKVDDAMAFGTGFHETTQMCLRMIEKYMKPGADVYEIGTGTGILAMAAAKCGAKKVLAIENDADACAVAKKNVSANTVSSQVVVQCRDAFTWFPKKKFDMIIGNLTADILAPLMPKLKRSLAENGMLIISGIHEAREQLVLDVLPGLFSVTDKDHQGEWECFVLVPSGDLVKEK